jgi:hypothetical protein
VRTIAITRALGAAIFFSFACLPQSTMFKVKAQNAQGLPARMIIAEHPNPIEPLRVVNFKFGEETVVPGTAFSAGDDWLANMSVTVKNATDKSIMGIGVQVTFLDMGDGTYQHPLSSDTIQVGTRPGKDVEAASAAPLQLGPGQEETIPFASEYNVMKTQVDGRQMTMSAIRTCRVLFNVYFSDGTSWLLSNYFTLEPNNPGHWHQISYEQFTRNSSLK